MQVGGTTLLGQTVSTIIDRTYPLEEMIVHVDIQMGAVALTPAGVDQIMGIVQTVTVNINDGVAPRAQVYYSGIGLLERSDRTGQTLDADTRETIAAAGALAANKNYRINYRIPFVHPQFDEPIRSRALLPLHLWTNDQTVVLQFQSAANMFSAGTITNIFVSFTLVQRIITPALSSAIVTSGGFLQTDMIETSYGVPLGQGGPMQFNIPLPGSYADLLFRHYLGGATITRDEISANSQGTAFGNETTWSIQSGQTALHSFRMKALRTMNDFGENCPRLSAAYAPRIGNTQISTGGLSTASSVIMDFLSDGCGGGDNVSELGSVLNCNIAQSAGLQMQLVCPSVANVATNASVIWIGGYRLYGILSNYQLVK